MFFRSISYIKFLLKSTNQHGVHSPFVYDLITKCFYKKTNKTKVIGFNLFVQKLKNNHKTIEVTDFGAGSKVFKNNHRQVSRIAKHAGISKKYAKLLTRITTYFSPNAILEIGTSLGIGTAALHLGNHTAKITTLEGCAETANIANNQFNQFQYKSINLIVGEFSLTLNKATNNNVYDLVYFDGNHKKTPTLHYFETCLESIHNDSIFIFDDIHWSKEMEEAWEIIKQHPKVKVTIDTYQWGIVFFRKEQEKEHFTIRV